jgi:hypothetical protein
MMLVMTAQQEEFDGSQSRTQAVARQAVRDRIDELGLNANRVAELIGKERSVVSRFLAGQSWPLRSTLDLIDGAIGWRPGTIDALGRGAIAQTGESLSADTPKPLVLIDWPPGTFDGMTEAEIAEIKAGVTREGLRIAREIRGS